VKVEFRDSFAKDLKGIRDKSVLRRAKEIIATIEKAGKPRVATFSLALISFPPV
jgi:hypothetical protein